MIDREKIAKIIRDDHYNNHDIYDERWTKLADQILSLINEELDKWEVDVKDRITITIPLTQAITEGREGMLRKKGKGK